MSTSNFSVYKVSLCALLALVFFSIQPVQAAQKRIALIIGNADYQSSSVTSLRNPIRDARQMDRTLRKLGFEVFRLENAEQWKIEKAFRFFAKKLKAADPIRNDVVALFYYSGHGAQANGKNYLLSVTSDTDYDVTDDSKRRRNGVVPLTRLFKEINAVGHTTNIIILDACRDNPPTKKASASNRYTRSAAIKGLQWLDDEVESNRYGDGGDPSNSIFAYATARGKVAEDGYGVNSPYTQHLLNMITQEGWSASQLFQQVGNLVKGETGGKQQPWLYTSLKRNFYFNKKKQKIFGGFK
jgi:uncharacterized caspase-like protein